MTGLVVEPTPEALAAAIDAPVVEPARGAPHGRGGARAGRRGDVGRRRRAAHGGGVTRPRCSSPRASRSTRRAAAASSASSGLYAALARLGRRRRDRLARRPATSAAASRDDRARACARLRVPMTAEHHRAEYALHMRAGVPVRRHRAGAAPRPHARLRRGARRRSPRRRVAAVACHPFAQPAAGRARPTLPLIYEAQNVETDLKASMLAGVRGGRGADRGRARRRGRVLRDRRRTRSSAPREDGARLGELFGLAGRAHGRRAQRRRPGARSRSSTPRRARSARRALGLGDAPLALFLGSWHEPNLAAVRDVLAAARGAARRALPRRRQRRARVRRRAGAAPTSTSAASSTPASCAACSALADAALNPMRWGSGTNLKMLDYALAGVPILSTRFGARGLGARGGRALRGDRAEELAAGAGGAARRCPPTRSPSARAPPPSACASASRGTRSPRAGTRTRRCASCWRGRRSPMIRVVSVARGNEVAGARILARDARRAPPGLGAVSVLVLPGRAADAAPGRGAVRGGRAVRRSSRGAIAGRRAAPRCGRRSRGRCWSATLLDAGAERVLRAPARRRAARAARRARPARRRTPRCSSRGCSAGCRRTASGPTSRDLLDAGEIDDELVAVRGDDAGRAFVELVDRARGARTPSARPSARAAARGCRARSPPRSAAFDGVAPARGPRLRRLLLEPPRAPARATPRGSCASRASAPTGRGGCPSTPRARSCSTTRRSRRRPAGARRRCSTRAGCVEAEGAGGARELPGGLVWNDAPAAPARAGARRRRGLRRHLLAGRRARVRATG